MLGRLAGRGSLARLGHGIPGQGAEEELLHRPAVSEVAREQGTQLLVVLEPLIQQVNESVDRRLLTLQREVSDTEDRLKRLYRSIEDGIVELDDILRERTATLKFDRDRLTTVPVPNAAR